MFNTTNALRRGRRNWRRGWGGVLQGPPRPRRWAWSWRGVSAATRGQRPCACMAAPAWSTRRWTGQGARIGVRRGPQGDDGHPRRRRGARPRAEAVANSATIHERVRRRRCCCILNRPFHHHPVNCTAAHRCQSVLFGLHCLLNLSAVASGHAWGSCSP